MFPSVPVFHIAAPSGEEIAFDGFLLSGSWCLEIGIEEQLPKKITGWWYTYPSEKYEFVNGKDDIPYIMRKKNVWNHQPDSPDQDSSDVVFPAHETELQHLRICMAFLRKKNEKMP